MLLVAYFLSSKEVGFYALAVNMAEILRKIPRVTSFLLYPRVTRLEKLEAVSLTTKTCRHVLFILVVLLVPFFYIVKLVIIPLLGNAYTPVLNPFMILLAGMLGGGILQLLSHYFYGRGSPSLVTRSVAIGLFSNVALNFLWIPLLGVLGAALASMVSYTTVAFLLIRTFKGKEGDISYRHLFVLDKDDWNFYRNFFRVGNV